MADWNSPISRLHVALLPEFCFPQRSHHDDPRRVLVDGTHEVAAIRPCILQFQIHLRWEISVTGERKSGKILTLIAN